MRSPAPSAAREGAFELANGGTLFLDEVGELPVALQAELLRVIQEGTFKRVGSNMWRKSAFRLVCATNRDLRARSRPRGTFRNDFYYRIAGCTLHLPSLRDRTEDIIPLFRHFFRQVHPEPGTAGRSSDAVRDLLVEPGVPGQRPGPAQPGRCASSTATSATASSPSATSRRTRGPALRCGRLPRDSASDAFDRDGRRAVQAGATLEGTVRRPPRLPCASLSTTRQGIARAACASERLPRRRRAGTGASAGRRWRGLRVSRRKFSATTSDRADGGRCRRSTLASSTPGCSHGPSDPNRTLCGPARATARSSRSKRRTPEVSVIEVRPLGQQVDERELRAPVVGEAAQVRDDEVHVRETRPANNSAAATSPITS